MTDGITRHKVHDGLKRLGLGGLDDPHLFDQIAVLYRDHDSFRGLLMSVEPAKRAMAYEALRAKLCFIPKPLDVYESEMKQIAEHKQLPTWNRETFFPEEFKVPDQNSLSELATEAIAQKKHEDAKGRLEMVCTRCTKSQLFPAPQRKQAVKDAHDAGWRWDERNGVKRQFCPDHVPGRGAMTLSCKVCEIKQRIRVWDEQDGYRDARRLGWKIEEDSTCPECVLKAAAQRVLVN